MSKLFIKQNLKSSKLEYSIDEFDKIAETLFSSDVVKQDYYTIKKVKNIMSKYSEVENKKIKFNIKINSGLTYDEIKNITNKKNNFLMDFKISKSDDENDIYLKDNLKDNLKNKSEKTYIYSKNIDYTPKIKDPPFGTNWIHDKNQKDDKIGDSEKIKTKIFNKLAKMKFPAQKSQAWLDLRLKVISASDGGCALGDNSYEPCHKLLCKKVLAPPFEPNENCYHGNKYEQIATMIYEYRMNVSVREFGLTQPAAILDKTAEIVLENFSKSEEEIKDGMDISICALNTKTRTL
jgi:hypothetical protein